ncbi:MAG: rhomboid family intramembrane serine protease [Myxococcales bacterium]
MAWRARRVNPPWPRCTFVGLLLIGLPTLLQFTGLPELLPWLERNGDAVARGELWRLLSAALVQDGGPPGALFNLSALLLVGSVAERWLSAGRWLSVALTGSLVGNLAGLLWQPVGAGNSALVFGLAGSLGTLCLRARVAGSAWLALSFAAALALLLDRDLHGAAACAGALVAWTFPRPTTSASDSEQHGRR